MQSLFICCGCIEYIARMEVLKFSRGGHVRVAYDNHTALSSFLASFSFAVVWWLLAAGKSCRSSTSDSVPDSITFAHL